MPEQLQRILQPIKAKLWDNLTKNQRIQLIGAVSLILIALVLAIYFAVRTRYVPLTNSIPYEQIHPIQMALNNAGIKNKLGGPSNSIVFVDAERVGEAQFEASADPYAGINNFTFNDMLTNSGMGTTESVKRLMSIEAMETKLAQALRRFDGVVGATVSLSIPEQIRLFRPDAQKPSAAVNLTVSRPLSKEEGRNMARFVARFVQDLELDNIEIVDNEFRPIFSGMQEALASDYNNVADDRLSEMNNIRRQVSAMLFPLCDEIYVTPSLIFPNIINKRIVSKEILTLDEGTGFLRRRDLSRSEVTGSTSPNAPGLDPNTQATPEYNTGEEGNYDASQQTSSETFDTGGEILTETEYGPSSYDRNDSSIAVNMYNYVTYFQKNMLADNPDLTQSQWDTYKRETRQRMINGPDIEHYKEQIFGATGIKLENIRVYMYEIPLFEDYEAPSFDIPTAVALGLLALLLLLLAFGLIRRQKREEEEEEDLEPELSVEDLLVSTQLEEAREEAEQLEEIDYNRENEIKKQIEKFVNEKPEAVASLLRNWLNTEEW